MDKEKVINFGYLLVIILSVFMAGLLLGKVIQQGEIKSLMDENNYIFCSKDIKIWYDVLHNNTAEYAKDAPVVNIPVS